MSNRCPTVIMRFALAILGLTAAFAVCAAGDDARKAQELINKMNQAARTLNYEGVFVYHHGDSMDTMRIIHKRSPEGEREKLISLTGAAREVIRDHDSVTCIFPDGKTVLVEQSRSRKLVFQLPQPIESVDKLYRFSTAGKDRVAGRNASIVDISPGDQHRYGYRLWIDEDTNLLLKSQLRDRTGSTLEEIVFTQVNLHDQIPDAMLEPTLAGTDYTWYENTRSGQGVSDAAPASEWHLSWAPPGFKMKERSRQKMLTSDGIVEHIIYTDGIAIVSVFIERLDNIASQAVGATEVGGVNAFARLVNNYQITAVGDVPRNTVERMVNSVVASN